MRTPAQPKVNLYVQVDRTERQQMRTPAQPKVNLYVQVDLETDKLRRRLESNTGLLAARLVTEALHLFAKNSRASLPRNQASRFADKRGEP